MSKANGRYYDFLPEEEVYLKPCPFCGGKAVLYGLFVPHDGDEINMYVVGCRKCDVTFTQRWDYDQIVADWNSRYKEGDETPAQNRAHWGIFG